uniref:Putative nucleotidyltransferase n=1 Tax=Streptomyces sp. NRRL 30471 TaxID=996287 RepID=F2WUD0_9ACTN|nr:putative nucleotidyltransferase [Streptomyces sp. NRRL 30471]
MADFAEPVRPDVSVILPCAGHGTRFGAAYPKELHCLEPGSAVVDKCLDPVLALAERGLTVRIVVVLGPHKLATAEYLHRYRKRYQLVFVYQEEETAELPGALRAALPLCTGPTLLVLADQVLHGPAARHSAGELLDHLGSHDWAVVAARVEDPVLLQAEGALRVEDRATASRVSDAAEKPADPAGFNAAWAMVGVVGKHRWRLPEVCDRSAPSPLIGAPVTWVDGFDNGTSPGSWS